MKLQNLNENNFIINKPKIELIEEKYNLKILFKENKEKEYLNLFNKILHYLHKIFLLIRSNNFEIEKFPELKKILIFLQNYKINKPTEFLKQTNLAKLIKFISKKINNKEYKKLFKLVLNNFNQQFYLEYYYYNNNN